MMLSHLNWTDGFSYILYTLLPVRSKRSVKDTKTVEKNRSAGWQKLELKDLTPPYQW